MYYWFRSWWFNCLDSIYRWRGGFKIWSWYFICYWNVRNLLYFSYWISSDKLLLFINKLGIVWSIVVFHNLNILRDDNRWRPAPPSSCKTHSVGWRIRLLIHDERQNSKRLAVSIYSRTSRINIKNWYSLLLFLNDIDNYLSSWSCLICNFVRLSLYDSLPIFYKQYVWTFSVSDVFLCSHIYFYSRQMILKRLI